MRSKKLCRPRGGNPRGPHTGHTSRSVVPRRDAGWAEEQTHLSLGQERLTSPRRSRSTHAIDLSVRCGLPGTRNRRRPRAAGLQHRSHAASSRRDRHQSRPRCPRHSHPRSSRLAWRQSPQGSRAISRSCRCRRARPNSTAKKTSGSSCVRIGCQTASSNPSTISSITAATPGTRSSINLGKSCPSLAAIGQSSVTQSEDWY